MGFVRRHLSYANIAATLALVFAMSGGALAATHYLINSTKQINPKVLKALKGSEGGTGQNGTNGSPGSSGTQGNQGPAGPTGNTGAQGPQGQQGPQGEAGPQGPEGGSVGPWATLTFNTEKLRQVSGYETFAVRIESAENTARLRGVLEVTSPVKTGQTLFTLPKAYWPKKSIEFGVGVGRAPGGEEVETNHVGALLISAEGKVTDPETPVPIGVYYLFDGLTWNLN